VRSTRRITLACDNRCVFCAQRGITGQQLNEQRLTEQRLTEQRLTEPASALDHLSPDEVTFVGGEPLLDPALPAAVAAARAAGARRVGVQTNARHLAAQADMLAAAGLTDVHVSLHGATAAVHDYHTGVDGSFAALVDGVAAARARGLLVVATTVLTRSNFRALAPLPRFCVQRSIAAWQVAVPRVAGAAADGFDRVVPRLALALPYALHAVDAALALGLPAFVAGAPRCLLGPFAARALDEGTRAYAPVCDGCDARTRCPGVDARYLERFSGDELQALHDTAVSENDIAEAENDIAETKNDIAETKNDIAVSKNRTPLSQRARALRLTDGERALSRLFVGPGPLALPPAAPRARVTLPLAPSEPGPAAGTLPSLPRVQPGRAEVAASAPRRSGEALREILPKLFEE
jgi:hypothetical protein